MKRQKLDLIIFLISTLAVIIGIAAADVSGADLNMTLNHPVHYPDSHRVHSPHPNHYPNPHSDDLPHPNHYPTPHSDH